MLLNFTALEEASAVTQPFPYLTASGVLRSAALDLLADDFPVISKPGIFTLTDLHYGKVFEQLIKEIRGRQLEALLEEKFQVTLADKPLMVTVRGQAQLKDGRIHADSKDKFLTCLLYLNSPHWNPDSGRLRLLRRPDSLDDMIAEIPPDGGTFIAFKRTDHSWHGHEPFEGVRRVVMFNWMVSKAALLKNLGRHTLSAAFKKLGGTDAY
ncbi:MAG: 2OG-Fe(II) oxygenase [Acidocella sp.]|nr:2OG-Fe(II) oxygenase [Acidocella sp.]